MTAQTVEQLKVPIVSGYDAVVGLNFTKGNGMMFYKIDRAKVSNSQFINEKVVKFLSVNLPQLQSYGRGSYSFTLK